MKIPLRKLSWALGIAGLLGILLQSLQVQVEHTHPDGGTPHSHSHGHSHSHHHGHDHHHHHHANSKEISTTPQTHIHVALLWWEFTFQTSSPQIGSPQVAEQSDAGSIENVSAEKHEPEQQKALKTQGPLIGSLHWSRLISEWYSAWQSDLPPDKNRLPQDQGQSSLITAAAVCYQSLCEAPPVPPPEFFLSVTCT